MGSKVHFFLDARRALHNLSSQDFVKDLDFECKNAVFEYKTAGCRTPLKGCLS